LKRRFFSIKDDIVEIGTRAYTRGYAASNDGNISARLDKKHLIITPAGISKGFMKTSDLVVVDMNGKVVSGKKKPSSEILLHLQIYKQRPDVNSVCHMHPPYATGFAVAGIPLEQNVLSEVIISIGEIPLVPFGASGTEELYKNLMPFLTGHQAFLLANHGALTVGTDVFNAYYRMETLEHYAQILFIAKQLGNVNTLNEENIEVLTALRDKLIR
jgi:L-fuculose-phosphate aldolase